MTDATQAQRLLDDPTLVEAFSAVVNDALAELVGTPIDGAAKREDLYRLIVAVDRVRGKLRSYVDDENLRKAALERKISRA
jgi:hypothetical protein